MAVKLAQALAWPVATIVALLICWRSGLLRALGGRITKLSFLKVSIELATVTSREPPGLEGLRAPLGAPPQSSDAKSILFELLAPGQLDYAVIDLGEGDRWLASRLFLFAELLLRQRGLRCIVFVDQRTNLTRHFVGLADPRSVRWALAAGFPWLEEALSTAYSLVLAAKTIDEDWWIRPTMPIGQRAAGEIKYPGTKAQFGPLSGRVDPGVAEAVVNCFLAHPNVQWTKDKKVRSVPPNMQSVPEPWSTAADNPVTPAGAQTEWTRLATAPELWEHTPWLSGPGLARLLTHEVLREDDWFTLNPGEGDAAEVRSVLSCGGDFVAVLNRDRCFRRLVERRLILERIAHDQLVDLSRATS